MSLSIQVVASFLVLDLVTLAVVPVPGPDRRAGEMNLTLEQVQETRRLEVTPDVSGSRFAMFDVPRLELRFDLDAPRGRKVVEVRQPSFVHAVDSTGADLSTLPPTGFGAPKHVDVIREWQKPPHALTFKLALPKRAATSFSLGARMEAVTYRDAEQITVVPQREWTTLPKGTLGEGVVKFRLESAAGSAQIVFTPGAVRDLIDAVELEGSGFDLESQGTMWNEQQVGYMYTGTLDPDARVTAQLTVRRGLQVLPIVIDLRDQPLP